MNQVKSIFNNTSWMSVSQAIASVCAFLWTIIIARYLGVSGYGIVSFAISFTSILGIFLDFGISTYITREAAKDKGLIHKFVNNIIVFKILIAIILFILSVIILYLLGYSILTIIVTLIFSIETVFISMTFLFNAIFQAVENLKYQSIGNILNSALLLCGILIIVGFNLGPISVAIAYAVGFLGYLLYMLYAYTKRFGWPKFAFDYGFIKSVVINSAPFGLTNFFYMIYFSIDIVMLSYLCGDYATGLYRSAYNIISIFTAFFAVYQGVAFPVMSKFFKKSSELVKTSYEMSVKYLLLILLPITVCIFFYAMPIMNLIYNNQYSLATTPMQILIWTVSFLFINGAATTLLNAVNRETVVTKIYIWAAIFNVILNLILIPFYSYDGAAIATVLSEILITILSLYHISKRDFKPDMSLLKTVIKLIFATLILAIVLYWTNLPVWLDIPIGLVVYIILLFITRVVDDNDRYVISELLKN